VSPSRNILSRTPQLNPPLIFKAVQQAVKALLERAIADNRQIFGIPFPVIVLAMDWC